MSRVASPSSQDSPCGLESAYSSYRSRLVDRRVRHTLLDYPRRSISVRRTFRHGNQSRTEKHGFTIAEVVIVSVVLTVLLAAVWSLFSLQQRTLERGQRLSRQSRVMLGVQRLFQDDLARAVLTHSGGSSPTTAKAPPTVETLDETSFTRSFEISEATEDAPLEPLVTPEFLFAGGTDWLIVDVHRPAYQRGAFDQANTTGDVDAAVSVSKPNSNEDLLSESEALPTAAPTPFERVIYLWLTDEEVESVTGLVFGYEDPSLVATERLTVENARDSEDVGSVADPSFVDSSEAAKPSPRRTLLRIRTDWSWPRENENTGTTWDEALDNDSAINDLSGLSDELGGLTPARQAWLRRLLWSTRSAYREFHMQAGSAIRVGQEATETNDLTSTEMEEDSFADDPNNASGSSRLPSDPSALQPRLPNAREPQVDWFPEIAAGKFQYFDGTRWQDSFATRADQPVPWAVRLEYELDADHYPGPVDLESPNQDQRTGDDLLLSMEPLNDEVSLDDPTSSSASLLTVPRPEFPQMVVWTYRQRASRGSGSDDGLAISWGDAEPSSENTIEESLEANSDEFAEAFRTTATPETGDR